MDRAIELLANPRRRRLLRYLGEHSDTVFEREDLARVLAPGDRHGYEYLETVLAHRHLPKIADCSLIEYDHQSGTIRVTGAVDELLPLLETFEEIEEEWG